VESVRIILFSGLVLHKLLWEVLKKRERGLGDSERSLKWQGRRLVKVVKVMVLAFLALQTLFLDLFPIPDNSTTVRMFGLAVYFVGLTTAVIGRLQLGQNWVDLEDYQVLPQQSLVNQGIYRYIRHPIYTGDILLLIGLELALNSWLVLAVAIPLLIAVKQTMTEEALLARVFPDYSAYCRQTKRFIPFII
jgi:protein-S-isoprenylcysteine O-methyltransferase Ste14